LKSQFYSIAQSSSVYENRLKEERAKSERSERSERKKNSHSFVYSDYQFEMSIISLCSGGGERQKV
jgi:ubiquitin